MSLRGTAHKRMPGAAPSYESPRPRSGDSPLRAQTDSGLPAFRFLGRDKVWVQSCLNCMFSSNSRNDIAVVTRLAYFNCRLAPDLNWQYSPQLFAELYRGVQRVLPLARVIHKRPRAKASYAPAPRRGINLKNAFRHFSSFQSKRTVWYSPPL